MRRELEVKTNVGVFFLVIDRVSVGLLRIRIGSFPHDYDRSYDYIISPRADVYNLGLYITSIVNYAYRIVSAQRGRNVWDVRAERH